MYGYLCCFSYLDIFLWLLITCYRDGKLKVMAQQRCFSSSIYLLVYQKLWRKSFFIKNIGVIILFYNSQVNIEKSLKFYLFIYLFSMYFRWAINTIWHSVWKITAFQMQYVYFFCISLILSNWRWKDYYFILGVYPW